MADVWTWCIAICFTSIPTKVMLSHEKHHEKRHLALYQTAKESESVLWPVLGLKIRPRRSRAWKMVREILNQLYLVLHFSSELICVRVIWVGCKLGFSVTSVQTDWNCTEILIYHAPDFTRKLNKPMFSSNRPKCMHTCLCLLQWIFCFEP